MTITIIRPGQKVYHVPGYGINVTEGGVMGGKWWEVSGKTCLAAYQPKGAASYAASKINLANPGTYNLADGAAYPTWDPSTGWTFVATSYQYLRVASFVVSEQATVIMRLKCKVVTHYGSCLSMVTDSDDNPTKALRVHTTPLYQFMSGNVGGTWETTVAGVDCVLAVNENEGYGDGVKRVSIANGTRNSNRLGIGGYYRGWGTGNYYDGEVYAAAIYAESLSGSQIAALSAAMAAL